jgi:hypothetical protein
MTLAAGGAPIQAGHKGPVMVVFVGSHAGGVKPLVFQVLELLQGHLAFGLSDAKLNATGGDFCQILVRLSVPHYLRLEVEDAETAVWDSA